jgi:hypothetical protein
MLPSEESAAASSSKVPRERHNVLVLVLSTSTDQFV